MSPKRSFALVGNPQLEPLEARLLLSADTLGELSAVAGTLAYSGGAIVSPELEAEPNDDLASAQELSFNYLLPWLSPEDGFGPQQAAVLGTADGAGGDGYDLTRTLFGIIAYPNWFSLDFPDAITPTGGGVLTITTKADLGGTSKYLTVQPEGLAPVDVFVDDGLTGVEVTTEVELTQQQLTTLAADGMIQFTITPSANVLSIGTGYVTMQLAYGGGGGGDTGDFYSFDLGAGESASVAVTGGGSGELELALYDAAGTPLATGATGADNVDAAIENFAADQAGTFYVRVGGEGDYALVVNRNAAMDLETNNGIDSAQEIHSAKVNGRQWAIGHIGGDGPAGADTDFYAVTLTARSLLHLQAYAPGVNSLEPSVRVYDSGGSLVTSGDGSNLRYRVPSGGEGVYYVQVATANETSGHYVLAVKSQLHPPKPDKPDKSDRGGGKAGSGESASSPLAGTTSTPGEPIPTAEFNAGKRDSTPPPARTTARPSNGVAAGRTLRHVADGDDGWNDLDLLSLL